MFELNHIAGNTYYIENKTNIGVYLLGNNEVAIIDSGNSKMAGKKIKEVLDSQGWKLKMILNTHAHADHMGGNHYLQEETGCRVFSSQMECGLIISPFFNPSLLYGGYPSTKLRHGFMMASEGSDCEPLETLRAEHLLPKGFEFLNIPGHTFSMVGYRTPDGVDFIGDAVIAAETIDEFRLSYLFDVGAELNTLEWLRTAHAKAFIPSHAAIQTEETLPILVQHNIDKINDLISDILEICREPKIFDDILKALFDKFNYKLNFEQYSLQGCPLRSYLAYLKDSKRMDVIAENNKLYWKTIS